MKIDIDYETMEAIASASLFDTYDTLYREILLDRQRIEDCPFNTGHILEDVEYHEEVIDALRVVLGYYSRPGIAEEKIRSIEAAIDKERELERYSKMFKNMRA